MQPRDGHVRLVQPVAHTTSNDSLAVSMGALEVLEVFKVQQKCLSLTFDGAESLGQSRDATKYFTPM